MFSYIILSEDFMGPDFASQVLDAKRWRTSIAHDHKYLDLAGTSFSVCESTHSILKTRLVFRKLHLQGFMIGYSRLTSYFWVLRASEAWSPGSVAWMDL